MTGVALWRGGRCHPWITLVDLAEESGGEKTSSSWSASTRPLCLSSIAVEDLEELEDTVILLALDESLVSCLETGANEEVEVKQSCL